MEGLTESSSRHREIGEVDESGSSIHDGLKRGLRRGKPMRSELQ